MFLTCALRSWGFWRPGLHQKSRMKPFHVCFFPSCLKHVPIYLKIFRIMLQRCFTVKLQKRFADYKTLPDFPSVQARVGNDWMNEFFWFWVQCSFKKVSCSLMLDMKIEVRKKKRRLKQTFYEQTFNSAFITGYTFIYLHIKPIEISK